MKKVLLLDDNEDAVVLQSTILESDGFVVETGMNGKEGLEKLKTFRPDIIVSDVLMPEMDGFQFCRTVKSDENLKDIPVVFYSAQYTDAEDKALGEEVGAEGFIYKPIEMEEFLKIINRILEQDQQRKSLRIHTNNFQEFDQKHYEVQAKMLDKKLHELEEEHTKLQESENKYRRLIDGLSSDYIIYRHDAEGKFSYLSPTVVDVLGYELFEYRNQFHEHATSNPINIKAEDHLKMTLSGVPQPPYEVELYAKDGTIRVLQLSEHPLSDSQGNVTGVEGLAHDVTQQKKSAEMERNALEKVHRGMIDMIQAIGTTIEKRDSYTAGHQQRVSELAVFIAQELKMESNRIEGLKLGALVHDIGKIAIPLEILTKPAKLKEVEFELIKIHSEEGYEILKDIVFPWPIAQMIRQHHERIDGSGYPDGLKGDDILLEARILAVADVVEAIASHRPYRPALGMEVAIDEITTKRGTAYDAIVVDACIRVLAREGNMFQR